MIEAHEHDGGPAFELYALGLEHKHLPETQLYCGLSRRPIFVPSVGHYRQGMLVSVPLHLDTLPGKPTGADLHAVLAAHYRGCDHVHVVAPSADGKLEPQASERDQPAGTHRLRQRDATARRCWWRGSTTWARARPVRRCRTSA